MTSTLSHTAFGPDSRAPFATRGIRSTSDRHVCGASPVILSARASAASGAAPKEGAGPLHFQPAPSLARTFADGAVRNGLGMPFVSGKICLNRFLLQPCSTALSQLGGRFGVRPFQFVRAIERIVSTLRALAQTAHQIFHNLVERLHSLSFQDPLSRSSRLPGYANQRSEGEFGRVQKVFGELQNVIGV